MERAAELARAQEKAALEAARFQFIFSSLPIGITWMIIGQPETRIVNPAQARMTGVPVEKCHQLELYFLATHPEDRGKQDALHRQLLERKIDHYTIEKRYVHADRNVCWTALTIRHMHDEASGQTQEICTWVDITERKVAEAALAQTSKLMESMLAISPDPIYFKDQASRFICASKALADHFNVPDPEALNGKSDFDCYPEDVARPLFECEQEIIRTGRPAIGLLEKGVNGNGQDFWFLTTKMPWRDQNGKIIGTFGISKDITVIKEAEMKLEKVHKELVEASRRAGMTEVATSVLHNVGNVLNSVNVSATLVSDQVRTSKVANLSKVNALLEAHEADLADFLAHNPQGQLIRGYLSTLAEHLTTEQGSMLRELESLRKNMEHIKEIVSMQQNYSKVYGIAETLPLIDLVEDALRMNAGAFVRHDVSLVRDYQIQPIVTLEKHKVLQILVNLMRNAKYACDESGRTDKQMKVSILNGNSTIKIAVIDNGVGIPQENLARIFSHGFTTRKDGHGYGLHSGALAARDIGGSLTAQSDGPGRGATFILELPFKQEGIRHE